jgi:hypothetical protein
LNPPGATENAVVDEQFRLFQRAVIAALHVQRSFCTCLAPYKTRANAPTFREENPNYYVTSISLGRAISSEGGIHGFSRVLVTRYCESCSWVQCVGRTNVCKAGMRERESVCVCVLGWRWGW